MRIIFSAANMFKLFAEGNFKTPSFADNNTRIRWYPPNTSFTKLNFDGLVLTDNKASSGFILRNSEGSPILASTKNVGVSNVLRAEAFALRVGLHATLLHGHLNIIVEGDSKILIDNINNKCSVPWKIQTLVRDIKILASKFHNIKFNHVWRETNFAADAVANLGHSIPVAS